MHRNYTTHSNVWHPEWRQHGCGCHHKISQQLLTVHHHEPIGENKVSHTNKEVTTRVPPTRHTQVAHRSRWTCLEFGGTLETTLHIFFVFASAYMRLSTGPRCIPECLVHSPNHRERRGAPSAIVLYMPDRQHYKNGTDKVVQVLGTCMQCTRNS